MRISYSYSIIIWLIVACIHEKPKNIVTTETRCYRPTDHDLAWYESGKKALLLPGLEGLNFEVSSEKDSVKAYVNQGLMLSHAFNHAEAARSFYEAIRLDSTCAIAYWGFALVLGPNYNAAMEKAHIPRAYDASQKALSYAHSASLKEQALIKALSKRYKLQNSSDRASLDIDYAAAMKQVYEQYPNDPDIGSLYVESLMDLHPWDLYDKHTKKPKAWTSEIVATLENLIQKFPKHPAAHHLYIHAMEASNEPEKALQSAELLTNLVPGAGHLLHMPSHIYINTGDYHLGSLANIKAIQVDSIYTAACHAQGIYPMALYPHNYHFLAATASLAGDAALAWHAAVKLREHTAVSYMDQVAWSTLQHYYISDLYIAVKFEMWDKVLTAVAPDKKLHYPNAIWHYARGMAFLGNNDLSLAKEEYAKLKIIAADTSLQELTIWGINTCADLVGIAERILVGKIARFQGQHQDEIQYLKEAVAMEDNLNYNEPPDWFFSVRHYLGEALFQAKHYDQSVEVYQEDLKKWKKNGWALKGLQLSLEAQQKINEAAQVKAEFLEAWKYADVELISSVNVKQRKPSN